MHHTDRKKSMLFFKCTKKELNFPFIDVFEDNVRSVSSQGIRFRPGRDIANAGDDASGGAYGWQH